MIMDAVEFIPCLARGEDFEPVQGPCVVAAIAGIDKDGLEDAADERFDRRDDVGRRVPILRVSGSAATCRCIIRAHARWRMLRRWTVLFQHAARCRAATNIGYGA